MNTKTILELLAVAFFASACLDYSRYDGSLCRSGSYEDDKYLYNRNEAKEGMSSPVVRKLYLLENADNMALISGCAAFDGHLTHNPDNLSTLRGL